MTMALFLVVLALRLTIVRGVICNDDPSLERDVFEEHGCTCGTGASVNLMTVDLFTLYRQAYDDCHEDDIGDVYTIDCSFSTLGNDEHAITEAIGRSMLDRLPVGAGGVYKNITCLLLNGNKIRNITYEHMKQFPKLRRLYLNNTQLNKIDDNALKDNNELITLNIVNNNLKEIPFLGHLRNLETFYAGLNYITNVDVNDFVNNTRLQLLSMPFNQVKVMPNISHHMELKKIHLEYNHIREVPVSHFYGLQSLHELILHHNQISRLEDGMCRDMCRLNTLDMSFNHIKQIDGDAFKGCQMKHLMLDNNDFSWLPYEHIRLNLHSLSARNVPSLIQFPQADTQNVNLSTNQTFPLLTKLYVTYAIHCCWYKHYVLHVPDDGNAITTSIVENFTTPETNCSTDLPELEYHICVLLNSRTRRQSQSNCPNLIPAVKRHNGTFYCSPQNDPFHPCYNMLEHTSLRVIIWFVIVISLCGNVLVFTVLLYGAVKKSLTVPQLMIMNLAAADFCLGLYLLFIAAADLNTARNYFNRAFDWERSPACKTAGFIAVLSSVASICILGLITFERMTTIVFTFSGNRFMTLSRTGVCLAVVWSIAFLFAILPVTDTISSYSEGAYCLPIHAKDVQDDVYIGFLLFFTGAVCIFILVCYVILFVRVKKTTSSLTAKQEFKIALKMAVLVATDFLIWFPIAVIGFSGVFTNNPLFKFEWSKYLLIFLFPLNSCINPVLYSLMQVGFRNQMCDAIAHFGLCKDYHKRRRNKQRGLTFAATSNQNSNRFRLGSITSVSTFTSFMSLFGKRSSVASLGSNECQLQAINKKSTSSGSGSGSISSDQNLLRESKFLSPIYESVTPTRNIDDPSDAVFYSENTESCPTSIAVETPTKNNSTIRPQQSDSDSGVANSDRDITSSNSGSSLDNTPQHNNVPDDDVMFRNEHASSTSSTTME